MKITGIVVEYNPLHQGHHYHIQQAKQQTNGDYLIACMSPNVVQRGEFSLIDKFRRTEKALELGIDAVVELPTLYTLQHADVFAYEAVKRLYQMGCDTLVFGSESNDLQLLQEIADLPVNLAYFKESMKTGASYAQSLSLSSTQLAPNDLLAIAYLRALKIFPMKAVSIQRTNHYHGQNQALYSASEIREHYQNPKYQAQALLPLEEVVLAHQMYPYFRYQVLASGPAALNAYFLVQEGIENHLYKCAREAQTYEDFLNLATTRRYTTSRIRRTMMHILLQHRTDHIATLPPYEVVRLLGFNQRLQPHLRQLQDQGIRLATKFGDLPKPYGQMELKATQVYALLLPLEKQKALVHQELSKIIIR